MTTATAPTTSTPPGEADGRTRSSSLSTWLFGTSVVVGLVPLVVALVRAVDRGWRPIGDNAFFAIRARDVFSEHLPLLGTGTSHSLASGIQVNNPGPLYFDLLAVPATLFPDGAGLAIGATLINALSVIGIALVARRRGGDLLGALAMAVASALCWAMGSELLFDPWQPHAMILPFLFYMVMVWSLAEGDLLALPFVAGVGSLLLQTHLSYSLTVPLLAAWGVLAMALRRRRRRARAGDGWATDRRRLRRSVVIAAVVFALCWAQPVVEQFTSEGKGNFSRLVENASEGSVEPIGYGDGTQLVASVVSLPPWWLRSSFGSAWLPSEDVQFIQPDGADLPGLGLAVASLVGLGAVMALGLWDASRRRDSVAATALATAAVAVVAGLLTAGRAPRGLFGIAPHQFRWLWPVSAFVTLALLVTVARRLSPRPVPVRAAVAGLALATLVFSLLNLPSYNHRVGPSRDVAAIPVIDGLDAEMDALEGQGPVLIDISDEVFANPYSTPIMHALQRHGIEFVTDDPALVRQLGPERRFTGDNATAVLTYEVGEPALRPQEGRRRVVLHEAVSQAERRELAALERQIADHLRDAGLQLEPRGRVALAEGRFPTVARQLEAGFADPAAVIASRELALMLRRDLVVVPPGWAERFARYADLQGRLDYQTIALYLAPLDR